MTVEAMSIGSMSSGFEQVVLGPGITLTRSGQELRDLMSQFLKSTDAISKKDPDNGDLTVSIGGGPLVVVDLEAFARAVKITTAGILDMIKNAMRAADLSGDPDLRDWHPDCGW